MLTSGQCKVAAYLTDGDIICLKCGQARIGFDEDEFVQDYIDEKFEDSVDGPSYHEEQVAIDEARELINSRLKELHLRELIQYDLDSDDSESGISCGGCGEVLTEPYEEPDEYTEEAQELEAWAENEGQE